MVLLKRGFSLIELMVVIGLLGGISLIIMNITKTASKSSTKFQVDSDITFITNEISAILSNPAKCLSTFTSPSQTTSPSSIYLNKYFISSNGSAPANGSRVLVLGTAYKKM